jgi:hypothetical protein
MSKQTFNPFDTSQENKPPVGKESIIDSRLQNLIDEAKARNAMLALEPTEIVHNHSIVRNDVLELKLKQISVVLKDGGMDTSSQQRSLVRIKEILLEGDEK